MVSILLKHERTLSNFFSVLFRFFDLCFETGSRLVTGWPEICYVGEAGLKLNRNLPASLPQFLG